MFVSELDFSNLHNCDVCIVGSGPVGLALACKLARLGKKVLVLESGDLEDNAGAAELAAIEVVDGIRHAEASGSVRRGLGGTSSLWGAGCLPYDPVDFAERPHVAFSGIPLAYSSMQDFHREACEFLGCGGPDFRDNAPSNPDGVESGKFIRFSQQPDMGKRHRQTLDGSGNIIVALNTTLLAIGLDPDSGKVSSVTVDHRGTIGQFTPRNLVLACGGVQNARLLLLAQRAFPALAGGAGGALGRYYMGHLTGVGARIRFRDAATGAALGFERDPDGFFRRRILTLGDNVLARHQLSNTYFAVGNFPLCDPAMQNGAVSAIHLSLMLRHRTRAYMRHYRPGYIGAAFEEQRETLAHLANMLCEPVRTVRGFAGIVYRRLVLKENLPGFHSYSHRGIYSVSYHVEHMPNPDSTITLSKQDDRFGNALPRVDLRFTQQDVDATVRAHKVLAGLLEAEGIGQLEGVLPDTEMSSHIWAQTRDGYHQIGGTRMAADPARGAVDPNLRVFGSKNLFVAGTSVLPTSSNAHPTFPAVALALRLADHLATATDP